MNRFIEIEYKESIDILPESFKNKNHTNDDYLSIDTHHAIINLDCIQGIEPFRYWCKDKTDAVKIYRYKIIYPDNNTYYIITPEEYEKIKSILLNKKDNII